MGEMKSVQLSPLLAFILSRPHAKHGQNEVETYHLLADKEFSDCRRNDTKFCTWNEVSS